MSDAGEIFFVKHGLKWLRSADPADTVDDITFAKRFTADEVALLPKFGGLGSLRPRSSSTVRPWMESRRAAMQVDLARVDAFLAALGSPAFDCPFADCEARRPREAGACIGDCIDAFGPGDGVPGDRRVGTGK